MSTDTTALFCCRDDFCGLYEAWEKHRLLPGAGKRCRSGKLRLSEMLLIMVLFHLSSFRDFKHFYLYGVCHEYRSLFRKVPHDARFGAIMPRLLVPLTVLLHSLKGSETGMYCIDSTALKVCHNKRISRHGTFEGIAKRGKTSMGWFFGLKLHLVVNHNGDVIAVKITAGNKDDRAVVDEMTTNLRVEPRIMLRDFSRL